MKHRQKVLFYIFFAIFCWWIGCESSSHPKKQALQEAAGGPSLKPAEDICAIFYYQLIYDVFVVSPF